MHETSQQKADRLLREDQHGRRYTRHYPQIVEPVRVLDDAPEWWMELIDKGQCRGDDMCRCHDCKPPLKGPANGWWILPGVLLMVLFWAWVAYRIGQAYYG